MRAGAPSFPRCRRPRPGWQRLEKAATGLAFGLPGLGGIPHPLIAIWPAWLESVQGHAVGLPSLLCRAMAISIDALGTAAALVEQASLEALSLDCCQGWRLSEHVRYGVRSTSCKCSPGTYRRPSSVLSAEPTANIDPAAQALCNQGWMRFCFCAC